MRYFITLVMTYAIRCKLRKSPLSQNKQIFLSRIKKVIEIFLVMHLPWYLYHKNEKDIDNIFLVMK